MILSCKIDGQTIKAKPVKELAEGTHDAICAEFSFSPEWSGMDCYAVFKLGTRGPFVAHIVDGVIPKRGSSLDFAAGLWQISVYGMRREGETLVERLTTNVARFAVAVSIVDPAEPFPGFTGSVGERTVAECLVAAENANRAASELRAAAEAGEFDGAPGATGPQGAQGPKGNDGSSVSIANVSESSASGGVSTVTFSDGRQLHIRNGLDGQGGGGSDEVLVAEYGVTTYAEVDAAATAGKSFLAHRESLWLMPVAKSLSNEYTFVATNVSAKLYHVATLSSAGWSYADYLMPSKVTDSHIKSVAETESIKSALADKADRSEIPDVPVTDVQLGGKSLLKDGVATIPVASSGLGAVWISGGGLQINSSSGWLYLMVASQTDINNRSNYYPIAGSNLDIAVKAAMTDGKGAAWTEAEQLAAQARLGIISSEGVGF